MHKLWLGFIQDATATASEVAGRVGEHTLLGARSLPSSVCASLGARPLPNDAAHKKTKNYIVEEDDAPVPKRVARYASLICMLITLVSTLAKTTRLKTAFTSASK